MNKKLILISAAIVVVGLAVSFLSSVERACVAAAINVSRAGCCPPTREELDLCIAGIGKD